MLMKYVLLLPLLLCISNAFAQQGKCSVNGVVTDKLTQQPLEFVTVEIMQKKDSTVVSTTLTDKNGKFVFHNISPGNFFLHCSYIGYSTTVYLDLNITGDQKNISAGTIVISNDAKNLSHVIVTGGRSILNTSIDRKSYDVTKDLLAQSGTASDILKNIPSVEVDIDGNISLRGSGDVMILINGRPSPLFGKMNKAEVLQQFPASSIERIEVITNPSARYKPDGTSGIINIVLKKNSKQGWNGSVSANAGIRDRYNASAMLNYKTTKFNIFGNAGIRKDSRERTNIVSRKYVDTLSNTVNSYYSEDGLSFARPITHLVTIGFTYEPDKNNSLGLSADYSNRTQVKNDRNTKLFTDKNNVYTNYFDRLRYDPEYEKEKDVTAFYEHKFPGEDHTLRVELNVAASKEEENNHYRNQYYFPGNNSSFDNMRIFQGDKQQLLTVDYSHTLSETAKLEAGYSGAFNQQDFNFKSEYMDAGTGQFVIDNIKTNRFLYKQDVHAFYGTFQKNYKKFGYSLGLRVEATIVSGKQLTKDTSINNNYLKAYPTLHLAYELNQQSQLQLNYSRRIHRPEGDDINPFPEYQDPYNVRAGNAKLLPEIIHSVEFGYKWQGEYISFVPSIYYRYKQNGFTQVTVPLNDSVLLTTQQNLSNDKSAGLELIFSAKAGKFFSSNLSGNFFYNQINATNLGYFNNKTILSFSTNLNSTFTISPRTMAQVSAIYYSSRLTPQGKKYPSFVLNAGIRQDFFKKKCSVIITASDILRTMKQKTDLNSSYLKQVSVNRRDGQIIYIGFSYRFGKTLKTQKEEKLEFDNGG